MKSMNDRKMGMGQGKVDSDGYFPEEAHHKNLGRPGELSMNGKYPDTAEEVMKDDNQFVSNVNKSKPKPGFRH
jgi:hypothetical protein